MMSLFAGKKVAEVVRKELNSLGNVINFDISGSKIFDKLLFGIEALEEDNEVRRAKSLMVASSPIMMFIDALLLSPSTQHSTPRIRDKLDIRQT